MTTLALATATHLTTAMAPTMTTENLQKRESFFTTHIHAKTHGIIMSICFVVLFPAFAMTLYLVPYSKTASRIHAPLQTITLCLLIASLGLGVDVETKFHLTDQNHPKIGYAVVAYLIVAQPLIGLLQHRYFKRQGGSSLFGLVHRWVGRATIILGIINGGLGLQLARQELGDMGASRAVEIAYGVVAGIIAVCWATLIFVKKVILKDRTRDNRKKASGDNGFPSA